MQDFYYIVRVDAEQKELADQVMIERTGYDEDLGFNYTIAYRDHPENPEDSDDRQDATDAERNAGTFFSPGT